MPTYHFGYYILLSSMKQHVVYWESLAAIIFGESGWIKILATESLVNE